MVNQPEGREDAEEGNSHTEKSKTNEAPHSPHSTLHSAPHSKAPYPTPERSPEPDLNDMSTIINPMNPMIKADIRTTTSAGTNASTARTTTASTAGTEEKPQRRSERLQRKQERAADSTNASAFFSSFFTGRENRLHRRDLPDLPRFYHEVAGHWFELEIREAIKNEWETLKKRGIAIPVLEDSIKGHKIRL